MTKEQTFDFLGITKFHQAGYTGKNIRIMSDEKIIKDYLKTDRWQRVICPAGYQENESKWHGSSVMSILQDVCPDATYYAYPFDLSLKGSKCAEYIKENNIHLFTTSNTGGKVNSTKAKLMQECIDNGCTFFAAAGNKGTAGILDESKSDKYLAIGICDFVDGKLKWVNPSSVGEEIDYVSLAGAYDRWTSWMTPQFCAMCGLAQDFFIQSAGRALKRDELIRFIDDNVIDVGEKGFDNKTGQGLFILPKPSSIDIGKYVPEYREESNMFNQNNYANIPYPSKQFPNATVKSGGCGLCCSANVLQYFGIKVDVKSLAEYFCDSGIRANSGTDMSKASEYIKKLTGCEVIKTNSEGELKEYLTKGGIAIANVDGINDIFSTQGHFINVISVKDNVFTIFDVGYYQGKFDSEYRKKYVTVGEENGNVVQYCKSEVLNLDTKERNPNYYIFYKKEETNMPYKIEEPSDWAKEAWDWGVANKICDGTNPKGTITREQVVQMMYNFFVKGGK